MQRTEVSRRAYQACVQAKACRQVPARFRAPGKGNLPMVGVTWAEARSYCRWRGGDLPTERQWVAAARGDTMPPRLWPWGRHAVRGCARILAPKVASIGPVGGQPCDASAFGVLGLAGNVREWVRRSSVKAGATTRIARGGSFRQAEWWSRAATRWRIAAGSRVDDVGLRCVGVRESGRSAKGR